ncbi:MAG: hypothetical protein C3F14_01120, partial [Deltaproteobacteria bacterium]
RLLYSRYMEAILETERWVREKMPCIDLLSPRLHSRHYRWWTFVRRFLQGQIMAVRHPRPARLP